MPTAHATRLSVLLAAGALTISMLTGCSPADATPADSKATLSADPTRYTQDDLCGLLAERSGPAVTPDAAWEEADNVVPPTEQNVQCMLTDGGVGRVRLTVSSTADFQARSQIDAQLVTSTDQCPGGASQPAVTLGGDQETTLVCMKDDQVIFTYLGELSDGYIELHFSRGIASGQPSKDELDGWVATVKAGLLASAGEPAGSEPDADDVEASGTDLVSMADIPSCGIALQDEDAYAALVVTLMKDTSDQDYVDQVVFESANMCGSLEDSPLTEALLQTGLTQDDLKVDWNSTWEPEAPVVADAPPMDSEPGQDCETVMDSTNRSGEGTLAKAAHEVTPASDALPAGVAFPQVPSCALELTAWDDSVAVYVVWERADFDAIYAAVLEAGWTDGTVTWTSPDGTQRKFMLFTPGGGLGWLDSGEGLMSGIAQTTVLLVYPL